MSDVLQAPYGLAAGRGCDEPLRRCAVHSRQKRALPRAPSVSPRREATDDFRKSQVPVFAGGQLTVPLILSFF
jgi:hypothetical protein